MGLKCAYFIATVLLISSAAFVDAFGTPQNREERSVHTVTVKHKQLCVKAGSTAVLDCDVRGENFTCSWTSDKGKIINYDDVVANKVPDISVSKSSNCGIELKNTKAIHHSTTFACQAKDANQEHEEASMTLNVIPPPPKNASTIRKRTILVSTSKPTSVMCHVPLDNVPSFWLLDNKNITNNSTFTVQNDEIVTELSYTFNYGHRHSSLMCCYVLCNNKQYCSNAALKMRHKAINFDSEYPEGEGVDVKFLSNPAPADVMWEYGKKCDDNMIYLDRKDDNITIYLRNTSMEVFVSSLKIHNITKEMEKMKYRITVKHDEGLSTYCTTYIRTGMGTGAIIGISVGVVATVTLLSLALYIYHKSRSENYHA